MLLPQFDAQILLRKNGNFIASSSNIKSDKSLYLCFHDILQ